MGWRSEEPGAQWNACPIYLCHLDPAVTRVPPSGLSSTSLAVNLLPRPPTPTSLPLPHELMSEDPEATGLGEDGQARHLEAVSFQLVSGYLIIHYRERGISISVICFMRSPPCQAAVSKATPTSQGWPRQARRRAGRLGCSMETAVPGWLVTPAHRPSAQGAPACSLFPATPLAVG